jgi:hypothetical protein
VAALLRAAAEFAAGDLDLAVEPAALAAARRSLESSGLLLLGEVHGVRENPLLIGALTDALGITSLALEWHEELAPVVDAFVATGTLKDHELLWTGDGRLTAGHLALLADRVGTGQLRLILFDGTIGADWSWTKRDQVMATRMLAHSEPDARTLVVAGNAHTATGESDLGVPMGAQLAAARPGVREVRVRYSGGAFYNHEPRQFRRAGRGQERAPLLTLRHGELVLTLSSATEAVVPQRPVSEPDRHAHREQ